MKIVRSVDVASAKINRCSSRYKYLIHKILATASCLSLYKYKHLRLCCLHSAIDQSAARIQSGYFLSWVVSSTRRQPFFFCWFFLLVQITQSNFFTNKTLSNLILFICFAKLATAWNYFSSSIDESHNQVSKRALITSWIQHCPFDCENFTYQHNLRRFYADKVSCNTIKATRSKMKKLTFSLAAMKFCNSMLRTTPAIPT